MAVIQNVLKGGQVFVYLGDNSNPIVYTAPCGFTSRSLSFSRSLNETLLPDCDNPNAPGWFERDVTSLSMSISGEGVLASSNIDVWMSTFKTALPVKVKVELLFPNKKHTYTGEMQLESIEVSGSRGETVSLNVSMQSSGEITHVSEDI